MDRLLAFIVTTAFTIAGMIFLVWLGSSLLRTIDENPWWIYVPVFISVMMVVFGYAALVDSLRDRQKRQQP